MKWRLKFSFIFWMVICLSLVGFKTHAKVVTSDWSLMDSYQKLISCGVIEPPFYGQRIWSEQQIVKQINQINLDSIPNHCDLDEVKNLLSHFDGLKDEHQKIQDKGKKVYVNFLDRVTADYNFISGGNSFFTENNVGLNDAIINSFREYKSGKILGQGHNFSLMTDHELFWQKQNLFLQPRVDGYLTKDFSGTGEGRATLQQGYLLLDLWKLNVLVGRAPLIWGQTEHGGFIFGENSRPLDHIQITNKDPFRLPWIFKKIGTFKLSYLFGNFGPEQHFPWTFFTGLSFGYKPVKNFEINLHHVFSFGGQGNSNDLGLADLFIEYVGFIPLATQSNKRGSNKLTSLNLRFFVPAFMGMQGYFDYFVDDTNYGSVRAFKKHFTHNSAYQVGFHFLRIFDSYKDNFRLEYTRTAPVSFRHSEFRNGWTENRNIIGDPLGPDAHRILLSWTHNWKQNLRSQLSFKWMSRENKIYSLSDDNLDVMTTFDGPAEKRWVFLAHQTIDRMIHETINLDLYLGFEVIKNYQYIANNLQRNVHFGFKVEKLF